MTKSDTAIVTAFSKGYRTDGEGRVMNKRGRFRKCAVKRRGNDARFTFTVALNDGTVFPIPVHRFVAYQKYKDKSFAEGIVVRHLDGDAFNNRPENIAIGTVSDNAFDRPKEDRQLHAQKGLRGRGKASEEVWEQIKADHACGMGYKKLRQKCGVSLSSLSYRLSTTSQYRLLDNR